MPLEPIKINDNLLLTDKYDIIYYQSLIERIDYLSKKIDEESAIINSPSLKLNRNGRMSIETHVNARKAFLEEYSSQEKNLATFINEKATKVK